MKETALIIYGALCAIIPAAILFGIFHRIYRSRGITQTKQHLFWVLLFAVYVAGVFHFTGAGTIFNIRQYGMDKTVLEYNLIPFSAKTIPVVSHLLNILLFIPLGFLLPIIWPAQHHIRKILQAGITFTLLIELSQLVNIRYSDVDDLLLNTLGALVGYALFLLYAALTKHKEPTDTTFQLEPLYYLIVLFLGRFLLFHEIGFARILYGF